MQTLQAEMLTLQATMLTLQAKMLKLQAKMAACCWQSVVSSVGNMECAQIISSCEPHFTNYNYMTFEKYI